MSLLSSFRKNKQEPAAEDSAFYSRAESDSQTVRPRKRKAGSRTGGGDGNAPVDPVLPEKKRARRRLVGAVALVLAVVIGLPMVLDSEPKMLADDVSIEIPSKDKPTPAPVRPRAAEPAAGATPGTSRVPAAAALDQKEEVVDPASVAALPAPVKEKLHEAAREAAAPKPAEKPVAKVEKSAEKPVERPAEKTQEKAAEKTAEKSTEKPADAADAKHGKYTVQVAAFASMEKVNELRGRLKSAGIASYTQKVATESGERIRIRVGPMNSRQDADKMRARLTELGLNGTLVPAPS